MVPSGIKVRNKILINSTDILDFIHVGEANAGYNTDKYACSFSKMIQYWRQTWNERTNGITDIQFPFGFVQVSFTQDH
jgi:sialate O-acetylesterase